MSKAEVVARSAHGAQKDRFGIPYTAHLERVAAAAGEDARDVAWLHDVLEDTYLKEIDLLRLGIAREVVEVVVLLSRRYDHTYAEFIERVKDSQNALAIRVKIADLKDHLREETLHRIPQSLRTRYVRALERLTA